MTKFTGIALLCIFPALCALPAAAADIGTTISAAYTLEPVIITGTKIPEDNPRERDSFILTEADIRKLPAGTPSELVNYICGAAILERSPMGTQGDLVIDGTSFEQALVMINGVRVNDMQTAHHNMDIPFSLADIERVELIKGAASSVHGSGALSGAVNFILKAPKRNSLKANAGAGSFGSKNLSFTAEGKKGPTGIIFSASRQSSQGFAYDRDLENKTVAATAGFSSSRADIKLTASYMEKAFGAFDFYTPGKNLPSREWTKTFFCEASNTLKLKNAEIRQTLYHRTHRDDFMLDVTRPSWYLNTHNTGNTGGELLINLALPRVFFAAGAEVSAGSLESSRLGVLNRTEAGLFGEMRAVPLKNLSLSAALRLDSTVAGYALSPSAGAVLKLSPSIKLRASAGAAYRNPSFTDLYYNDPLNSGNQLLIPERGFSLDAGLDCEGKAGKASLTVFSRKIYDLIDWISENKTGPWRAENTGEAAIAGLNGRYQKDLGIFDLGLNISQTSSGKSTPYFSKYPAYEGKTDLRIDVSGTLPFNLSHYAGLTYSHAPGGNKLLLASAKLSYKFRNIDLDLSGNNLFDCRYEEIPGISMPGRTLMLSAAFGL